MFVKIYDDRNYFVYYIQLNRKRLQAIFGCFKKETKLTKHTLVVKYDISIVNEAIMVVIVVITTFIVIITIIIVVITLAVIVSTIIIIVLRTG